MVKLKFRCSVILLLVLEAHLFSLVSSHGRLMEPPNRSSLWRLPEFASYEPDKNYDDNQLWCGGMGSQFNLSKGKCGPCGDEYIMPRPRENENTGIYGRGIVTRKYQPGQVIDIGVELTVNHLGYFLFNLCPLTDVLGLEEEECFEKYPLPLADGSGYRFKVESSEIGFYNTTVRLPSGITCRQCVVRWHYRTGNRWNFADNQTSGGLGIGDQETFRGCSDVAIGDFEPVSVRPPMPTEPTPSYPGMPVQTSTYAPPTSPTTSRPSTSKPTTLKPMTPRPTTTRRPMPPRPTPTTSATRPTTTLRPMTPKPPSSSGQIPAESIFPSPGAPTQRPPRPAGTVVPATSKPAGVSNSHPHPIMRPPANKNKAGNLPVIIATLGGSTKENTISNT